MDERGVTQHLPLEQVAYQYLMDEFFLDLLAFLPLGYIFSIIDERFKILWVLKAIRTRELRYYLSKKFFDQFINIYIEYR